MLNNLLRGEEVIIRRQAIANNLYDEYGQEVFVTTDIVVEDVLVNYVYTTESKTVEEQAKKTQVVLYFLPEQEIKDNDIFIVKGSLFQGDGLSFPWKNQFTVPSILQIRTEVPVRQLKGDTDA